MWLITVALILAKKNQRNNILLKITHEYVSKKLQRKLAISATILGVVGMKLIENLQAHVKFSVGSIWILNHADCPKQRAAL